MERRDYLVFDIRPAGSARGAVPTLESLDFTTRGGTDGPLFSVESLTETEASDLRRGQSRVVVEPMPVALVAPKPGSDAGGAWGLEAIGATTTSLTGAGATVAVLDTGVDATHPAFTGVTITARDFTGTGETDTDGHGTHCAGTILGRDVNGTRIGVARWVTALLSGKVLAPGSTTRHVVEAVEWALQLGANVISMSLGIDFVTYAESLRQTGMPQPAAISRALASYRDTVSVFTALAGRVRVNARIGSPAIIVAAAGNGSQRSALRPYVIEVEPPASVEGVISVAALDHNLAVAEFSNIGAHLSAPGVDIVSAGLGGGLASLSGTSMATPHVAGVAALWYEKLTASRSADPWLFTSRLIGSARTVDGLGGADGGAGLVTAPAS
jgi:subtilisin family serine protease